jgi:hypothetical protein
MMLAVFRVIGGLKNAEHRTDAVFALLALLGALLPLVVNFLVGRCSRKSTIAVLCPSGPLAVVIDAAYGEAFGPRLSILGQFRKWGPSRFAKKGTKTIHLSEALPTLGEYAAVVMWERNLL